MNVSPTESRGIQGQSLWIFPPSKKIFLNPLQSREL